MKSIDAAQAVVLVWFASSILVEVVSHIALLFWLRARRVRFVLGFAGFPGYLESKYTDWCRMNNRSSKRVIRFRLYSMVNLILCVLVAIPVIMGLAS